MRPQNMTFTNELDVILFIFPRSKHLKLYIIPQGFNIHKYKIIRYFR